MAENNNNREMKDNKDQRGIEIVNMLAQEGFSYSQAYLILLSARSELDKRKHNETKDKCVAKE